MDGYQAGKDVQRLQDEVATLKRQMEGIMASVAEIQAKLTTQEALNVTLQETLDTEQQEVADALAAINQTLSEHEATIADLRAQIEAGATDQAALQEIADRLDASNAAIVATTADLANTIVPAEPPAEPPVEPETPPEPPVIEF